MSVHKKLIKCPKCRCNNMVSLSEETPICIRCKNSLSMDKNLRSINVNHHYRRSRFIERILICLVLLMLIALFSYQFFNRFERTKNRSLQQSNYLNENADGISLKDKNTPIDSYSRTAFVLYPATNKQERYLFKATFLTDNQDTNDTNAVLIKQNGDSYIGLDAISGEIIPNFGRLVNTPFSIDAEILYSDTDYVIVKNKVNNQFQLEMIDSYTGQINWTLSNQEILGLEKLTAPNSSTSDSVVSSYYGDFKIQIPPNYYIVDKYGEITDFGDIDYIN